MKAIDRALKPSYSASIMAAMLKANPKNAETVKRRSVVAVERVERIVVDDATFEAFTHELENPSPPTAKLVALFRR